MLSVQRIPSETHLRQAAEFVFLFEWSTCFVLHDRLIYHTFSHCQAEFRIFFRFFFNLHHSQDFFFSEEHHVLLHYQNALLRTLQYFEIFLEEHRAFLQVLKQIAVKVISHPNCTLFRFHHSLFPTEYIFFNQHRCHFCHHALTIPSIFHLSNNFSKKFEKKFKFPCFPPQMTVSGALWCYLSIPASPGKLVR